MSGAGSSEEKKEKKTRGRGYVCMCEAVSGEVLKAKREGMKRTAGGMEGGGGVCEGG